MKLKIKNEKLKIKRGITFVELLVVIGILMVVAGLAIPAIYNFPKEADLVDSTQEVINTLRLAQNKTVSSEGASQWGVYFTTSTAPHQYILFKGENFAQRTTSSDEISKVAKSVEFYQIDLAGGGEVVFQRITGETLQKGKISLRLKKTPAESKTIFVENSGNVGLSTSPVSDTARVKDSRHVHFDYSRVIVTSTEKLILTFEGGLRKEIVIADNMSEGQIYWQGEVEVGGEPQILKIHTHRLNNPDTQFSIHCDRRYNNKALDIDIDGDPDYPGLSPTLIRYTSVGATSKGNSIYVSNPVWQ